MAEDPDIAGRQPGRFRRELILFDVYRDGHRRDYFRVLRRVLGGQVVWGRMRDRWPLLLSARRLVCSTCDDYLAQFVVLALVRALLGRTTVGLSVRSETIFQRSGLAQRVKRAMLRVLKMVPRARLITFMPYWVEPRLERYTADWMYDIQYWDLPWVSEPAATALADVKQHVRKLAAGRKIVVSVGYQRRVKGIEYLMEVFSRPEVREGFLFVCIGPSWDLNPESIRRFVGVGGVFVDRALRDDEVLPIYSIADLVWVCYRPEYDQSSGIFGRAIQLDLPTIVRENSYLAMLQTRLGKGGIVIPYGEHETAGALLVDGAKKLATGPLDRPERTSAFLCQQVGVRERSCRQRGRSGVPVVPTAAPRESRTDNA